MFRRAALCLIIPCIAVVGCEKTTVEGPNAKKLTLVKPADQTIKRGDAEKVSITVKRTNFNEPVTVQFENLPKGVTVTDDGGKIEGNERTFVLNASDSADLVQNYAASVSVKGPDGMTATEQFRITVRQKT